MYRNIKAYLAKYFRAKKIVVISQEEIVSIPLGPSVQVILFCMFAALAGWLSYSSGKYFAYQNLLDKKEQEITHTALTNQNLLLQMTDLHANLQKIDSYFKGIDKYDHAKADDVLELSEVDESHDEASIDAEDEKVRSNKQYNDIQDKIFGALGSVDDGVRQRIKTLEDLFQVAGIDLDLIKKRDEENDPENALLKYLAVPQGGPFDESNDSVLKDPYLLKLQLDQNIGYLLYLEDVVHALPLTKPMRSGYVSSGFGYRIDPIRKKKAMHHGLDFVGTYRAKVYSTAPGTVIKAGRNGAYGKFVEIDHGRGVTTRYGHMSKLKVTKGEVVKRGQVIGLQGNTGRSTGAHLHYEIRYAGSPLNPYNFLKAGEYVF